MTIRELPFEEWDKLEGLPFVQNGLPDPSGTRLLVAETPDGQIVGTWALMSVVFLEGMWVHPDHRKTTVTGRLVQGMKRFLHELGVYQSFTMTQTDEVRELAYKAGFQAVPGDVLVLHDETLQEAGI